MSLRERITSSPPDARAIGPAVFEVARGILAAEASPDGIYPSGVIDTPLLEATAPYLDVISGAELDPLETLILRVLVTAEIDRDVHRVIRRLSAEPSARATPVDGVITVVEGLGEDPVAALRAFWPESPLVARGLARVIDGTLPPLSQQVTVPTRILAYLTTGEAPPPTTPFSVEPALPIAALCPLPLRNRQPAAPHLRKLVAALDGSAPVWVVGNQGSGRRTLLAAVAGELGKRLLCISQRALSSLGAAAIPTLWRELLLGGGIVCIYDAEPTVEVGGPDQSVRTASVDAGFVALVDALVAARVPAVFSSSQTPPVHEFDHPLQVVQLEGASREDALALWTRGLPEVDEVPDLATRFRLPPGRIVRAISAARVQAEGRPLTAVDVTSAISLGVAQQVSLLGTLIQDTQTWADIVLPVDTREAIDEMVARVRHRHHVLDQWGFRGKLSKGLGIASLFHGPPGTGKTMIASLIARELGQELYQIDLSRMVSKWIGETEKNLAKVFDAAEGANVLLLFDEADSMFSKRTEVSSSNDRHANAEVNYLLQRVERFEGVCILTTNFERSIDAAFKRRLSFRIEFPMPDVKERLELWKRMMPAAAQLAPDIDYSKLARNELAGGNIRNAMLRAAFLAASKQSPITMALLERAVALEYRDAGKLATGGTIHS